MRIDSEDLNALREAIAATPHNVALRLQVATRLLELDEPHIAWHHCARILAEQPDHLEALRIARDAALACGVSHRAEAYDERLARLEGRKIRPKPAAVGQAPKDKIYRVKGRSLRLIQGGKRDEDVD
jgi:hypothetical protein